MSSTEESGRAIGLACTETWLLPPWVGRTHSHIKCKSGYKLIFKSLQRKESPSEQKQPTKMMHIMGAIAESHDEEKQISRTYS